MGKLGRKAGYLKGPRLEYFKHSTNVFLECSQKNQLYRGKKRP